MRFRSLFDRKGLSLERMAAFCEFAEHGSIVAATGGDPARQALVSRQISELESFFEIALVVIRQERSRLTGLEIASLGKLTYGLYVPKQMVSRLPARYSLQRALPLFPLALPIDC
ncbi:MAG: LysR family transcriptional regulator [Opitutales bacterium]|nr:LysR family transcriptional regulator [Opitutales bacterium]